MVVVSILKKKKIKKNKNMIDSVLNQEKSQNKQINKIKEFRIREEQYKLRETRFYPEKSLDNTYIQLSDKKYGLIFNDKGYCDSYEDAVSVIERFKISQDNTIIKEIIHEYND